MKDVRCMVCRQTLPTLKILRSHCLAAHSKAQLVRALLKNTIYQNKRQMKTFENKFDSVRPQYLKSEILFLEDGFQNSLPEEDSLEITVPFPKIEIKSEPEETESQYSFDECDSKNEIKKVIAKVEEERNENLLKLRNFRFDKTLRKRNCLSLNDQTGFFYVCRCSENEKANNLVDCYQKEDLQNLISDTDSCSEAGNFYVSFADLKFYCDVCGNGYTNKRKLIEHFEVHNTNCRMCKKRFKDRFSYKQHMKKHLLKVFICHLCGAEFGLKDMLMDHLDAHIEDDIYENVFSLEQDYKIESNRNICHFYFG